MLLYHLDVVLRCFLAFYLFVAVIAFTAYRINLLRVANDPKKRYYHPLAIPLAPIIFVFCVPPAIAIFILAVILYGVFLIFFVLMLFVLRQSFLLVWWNKFATFVGEPLLRIGTYLILLPFRLINPRLVQQIASA